MIWDCCEHGYKLGFRSFVLQGGEDPKRSDNDMEEIIAEIRRRYPECAITLSIGEKPAKAYERYFMKGARSVSVTPRNIQQRALLLSAPL